MNTLLLNKAKALAYRTVCGGHPERYYALKYAAFRALGALDLYERAHFRFLATAVRPGDRAIDIGAHFGVYSRFFLRKVGPSGHVVAVEPFEPCVQRLRRWAADRPNVAVVAAAVADSPGRMSFSVPVLEGAFPEPALGHLASEAPVNGELAYEIDAITVATLCSNHPSPDVVKIDVEGGEAAVLAGLADVLGDKLPRIVLFESWDIDAKAEVVQQFQEVRGHRLCHLDESGRLRSVAAGGSSGRTDDPNYYLLDRAVTDELL